MRLDLHTDYALRTLIFLAGRPGRASVAEVAGFYGISKDHVAKVVQTLVKMGYLRSQRGVGGGIELARSPDQIRIGHVIAALEGNMHLLECVGTDNVCAIQPGCRLRRVLAQAERIQREYLDSVRLSDVVEPGGWLREFEPSAVTPPLVAGAVDTSQRTSALLSIAPLADSIPAEPGLPSSDPSGGGSPDIAASRVPGAAQAVPNRSTRPGVTGPP